MKHLLLAGAALIALSGAVQAENVTTIELDNGAHIYIMRDSIRVLGNNMTDVVTRSETTGERTEMQFRCITELPVGPLFGEHAFIKMDQVMLTVPPGASMATSILTIPPRSILAEIRRIVCAAPAKQY